MEDENNNGAETSVEAFTELQLLEREDQKEGEAPVAPSIESQMEEQAEPSVASNKLLFVVQKSKAEAETPAENSTNSQSSERDTKDNAEMPAEASTQSQPPENEAASSLRARAKAVKKPAAKSFLNSKQGKATLKVHKKIVKKKKKKGASLVINERRKAGEENDDANGDFVEKVINKEAETVESLTELQTSEQESGKVAEIPVETFVQAKAKSPQKRTPDSLKAGAKIVKKALPRKSSNNAHKKAANKVHNKIVKKKGVSLVLNEGGRNSDETIREPAPDDNNETGTVTDGQDTARNKVNSTNHNEDKNDNEPALGNGNDSRKTPTMQGKVGKINKRQKKHRNDQGRSSNDGGENLKKKEKLKIKEADQGKKGKEKKEKIGGLIFFCSTKTKPDCLNYSVMGVPESQKDVALAVKPGLKLFLYDFDLKLMYGIYKASSAGGKKLEPRAFGGSFPYQVRFRIHVDCFPLPETIFKNAMMENFITKHKFKTELTFKQVRKLTELFRPVEIHPGVQPRSNNLPPHSTRKEWARDRDVRLSVRESRRHLQRETMRTNPYARRDDRRYTLVAREGDRLTANREVREEPHRQMFLTEAEYRAYGLRGERRYSDLPSRAAPPIDPYVAPPVDPYWEDYERRRQSDVLNRDAVAPPPAPREYANVAHSYPDYRDYQNYSLDTRTEYPFGDRYLDYQRRAYVSSSEAYSSKPDWDYRRREIDPVDRLYTHSSHADYDLMRRYQINDPNPAALPVSSRYAFAGPR